MLAGEHGTGREQPLAARARALVVVEELERAFAQLEQRDIGGRADIERAPVIEDGNTRAALTVAQAMIRSSGMPNMMNFDMTFGKSTTPVVFDMTFQSVEKVSGQNPCAVARSTVAQSK